MMRTGSRAGRYGIRCSEEAEWRQGWECATESLVLPGVCLREVWVCLQRKLWGHVCVCRMYVREGFHWCRSGRVCAVGCGVQGWREERVWREGGLLWSARNTHFTKGDCQLPETQISLWEQISSPWWILATDPTPGCLPDFLIPKGRDRVSGFLPHPDPWSFPGTDVFACVLSQCWSQSSISWHSLVNRTIN